jgi:methylated-DNA-[protein]-cysteine S-methyltransferase
MTPRHLVIETSTLGKVILVAAGDRMTGLLFEHHHPRPTVPLGARVEADGLLARAAAQLDEYLAGRRRTFDLPLRMTGDLFLQRVWSLVQQIPYGSTTTYGVIAGQLAGVFGDEFLSKRVGGAAALNPLCVIVPCHRVVGANGSLTGYAGGIERKRGLLRLESAVDQQSLPLASPRVPESEEGYVPAL